MPLKGDDSIPKYNYIDVNQSAYKVRKAHFILKIFGRGGDTLTLLSVISLHEAHPHPIEMKT
jgi:hypothetical protein